MASAQQPAAPLAGVTVVALEQAVSAPMCTRALADFGARVIKVENPPAATSPATTTTSSTAPGGLAAHFVWANRNKESVALDLKAPEGIDILHRLLDRADVLVSNLAPGSTARLGISPDQLRDRHPGVIAVEIDGYGRRTAVAQARVRPSGAIGVGLVRGHRLSGQARQTRPADRRHLDRPVLGAVHHGAAVLPE